MAESVIGVRSLVLLLFVSEWVRLGGRESEGGDGARGRGGEGFLFHVQVSNKCT